MSGDVTSLVVADPRLLCKLLINGGPGIMLGVLPGLPVLSLPRVS